MEEILYNTETGGTLIDNSEVLCICETKEDAHSMAKLFETKIGLTSWKKEVYWDRKGHMFSIMPVEFVKKGNNRYGYE